MSEKISTPLAPKTDAATTPQPGTPAPVAVKPSAPAPVAAPPASPMALFGGHKGGGKKRADGLIAGSEEAIKADREKNRLRMAANRQKQRSSELPTPLARPAASPASPSVPLADDSPRLPDAPPGAALASDLVRAPGFVAWSKNMLAKPVKLLTKIVDRVRVWSLRKKIVALQLEPADEKEIMSGLAWQEGAVNDFNDALADFATIELNKRQVPGAEHSHWAAVLMSGGELVLSHVNTLNRLEELLLKKQAQDQERIAGQKN